MIGTGFLEARREQDREQLRLVADFGERDDAVEVNRASMGQLRAGRRR
jgi:hypothetical protein